MPYIFDLTVKDNLWKDSIFFITLFSISLILITGLGKYLEVRNNWDRMRCRPEVMQYAWMYGKNTADNMEYCLENAGKQVKQSNIVNPLTVLINDKIKKVGDEVSKINGTLNVLDNNIKKAETNINKENTIKATAIQTNILALKEGLQKVIAGAVIQQNLSNGILKTTRATEKINSVIYKKLGYEYQIPT